MTFNEKDLESFGFAKAIKFDASYYSDFERQEITYRGLLRSYLEIPVIRRITVSAIVKDMNKYELDLRIKQISEWLYKAGEGKLMTKRDETQYYKARCIGISVPVFKGSSATFSITFECSDYRAFRSKDDTPIGDATTAITNFTFAGKHCLNDMKCLFNPETFPVIPSVTRNAYEISGRSGTLRYDDGPARLSEKTFTGKLYFLKDNGSTELMTPQEISERQHEIASWLVNANRARLVLDNDASRYYEAEVIDESEINFDDWANGVMSISFLLQPYSQDINDNVTPGSVSLAAGSWNDYNLSDIEAIGYTTPLLITLKNNGSSAITDLYIAYYDETNSEKRLRFNGNSFSLAAGQTITIDSASYEITIGGSSALKYVKSGDFPIVTPNGNKKIRLYSNVATTLGVSVSLKPRWL